MLKKFATVALSCVAIAVSIPAQAEGPNADDMYSCFIELAVSTSSPAKIVAFNVTNNMSGNKMGISHSATLAVDSGPKTIDKLPCAETPYIISATAYNTDTNILMDGAIGQCVLKAGLVMLSEAGNSVSVVFPNDFNCQ